MKRKELMERGFWDRPEGFAVGFGIYGFVLGSFVMVPAIIFDSGHWWIWVMVSGVIGLGMVLWAGFIFGMYWLAKMFGKKEVKGGAQEAEEQAAGAV